MLGSSDDIRRQTSVRIAVVWSTPVVFSPSKLTAAMRARRGLIQVNLYRGHSETCLEIGRDAAAFGRPDDIETLLARVPAGCFFFAISVLRTSGSRCALRSHRGGVLQRFST